MSRARNDGAGVGQSDVSPQQRLDKWLWFARIVRNRPAAAELAASGHVRINGQRTVSPSRNVRPGDVLTVALDRRVLVLRVADMAARRGGYPEARLLYEDLTRPESDEIDPRRESGLRD